MSHRCTRRVLALIFTVLASSIVPAFGAEDGALVTTRVEIGRDPMKTYLLHRHEEKKPPRAGHRLLLVLPGGNGSADFQAFVKRILEFGLSEEYVVAQVVAPKWSDQQKIIWPTGKNRVQGQKFTTEQLIEEVVTDVRRRVKTDPRSIYCMAWSSSGPAVYASSLQKKTQVTGYFISQSVFRTRWLPSLRSAKGRCYFIEHSPDDKVCPFSLAEEARDRLEAAGARVEFSKYDGGHGWRGDVYGRIKKAISWLERQQLKRRR